MNTDGDALHALTQEYPARSGSSRNSRRESGSAFPTIACLTVLGASLANTREMGMISDDEAERRGLRVVRGVIVGLVLSVLGFWIPLVLWVIHRARP